MIVSANIQRVRLLDIPGSTMSCHEVHQNERTADLKPLPFRQTWLCYTRMLPDSRGSDDVLHHIGILLYRGAL